MEMRNSKLLQAPLTNPALVIKTTVAYEPWSKLLKGGYLGDYIGNDYRGY